MLTTLPPPVPSVSEEKLKSKVSGQVSGGIPQVKLDADHVQKVASDLENNMSSVFGDWIHNHASLATSFSEATPFPHVVIDNFLATPYAEEIARLFPSPDEDKDMVWWNYCNPIEVKRAYDSINTLDDPLKDYFYFLSTQPFLDIVRKVTSIPNLESDPHLHGAGIHAYPRNARLNMHLDYEIHPITGKQRRLNIILYVNPHWPQEWNGDIQLWDKDMQAMKASIAPVFNRAVLFQTNEISWHGLPDRVMCPPGMHRKSLAFYYVSDPEGEKEEKRLKARFVKRPQDPVDARMEKLYAIRPDRRITEVDMKEIWPEWTPEMP